VKKSIGPKIARKLLLNGFGRPHRSPESAKIMPTWGGAEWAFIGLLAALRKIFRRSRASYVDRRQTLLMPKI
jgi:hypothetical protein